MNLYIFRRLAVVALWPLYRTTFRSASGWSWRSVLDVLGVKQPSQDIDVAPSDTTDKLSNAQSREELLHGIACTHLQEIDSDCWKKASLGGTHLKGKGSVSSYASHQTCVDGLSTCNTLQALLCKFNRMADGFNLQSRAWRILCDYESTFSQSIPNQDLGTINTFGDLLEILKNYTPPQDSPHVYPLFGGDVTLPRNLSIQFINTAPAIKPNRRAFQNYDARHPEHANFLTNMEKAKKRKRRRHLTALK